MSRFAPIAPLVSCASLLACLCSWPAAHAADAPAAEEPPKPLFNYALGAIVGSSPDYAGGDGRKNSLRPAWAIEYGRFRLSTSRGSAFMGHGLGPRESGASATLAQGDQFNLSASLRIDKGRDGSDAPILVGLPSVRSTLRARVSAGYALTPRWSVGAGLSQDILGRDGGAQRIGLRFGLVDLALGFLRHALGDQFGVVGCTASCGLGLADGCVGGALGLVGEFTQDNLLG